MGEGEQLDGDSISAGQLADEETVFPDPKLGKAWCESITKVRAAGLEELLQAWEQEAEPSPSPTPTRPTGLQAPTHILMT